MTARDFDLETQLELGVLIVEDDKIDGLVRPEGNLSVVRREKSAAGKRKQKRCEKQRHFNDTLHDARIIPHSRQSVYWINGKILTGFPLPSASGGADGNDKKKMN